MGRRTTSGIQLVAAVFALSGLPCVVVRAASVTTNAATMLAVDISPQPLAMALLELCKQGNLQLVISAGGLPGTLSPAVHGNMALGAALEALLRDTGLTYRIVGDHTVAIARADSPGGTTVTPSSAAARAGDAQSGGVAGANQSGNADAAAGEGAVARRRGLRSRIAALLGLCVDAAGERTPCDDQRPPGSSTALAEVVVTGSRINNNGNDSPTPVTVLTSEQLLATQPTTLQEALTFMPQFIGSQTQSSNPGPSANNASAAYLSLRSLGSVRSLVLFDGHRVPSTAANGAVDSNQIPQLLIKRVDVVTGGASAVYGSDAVAGVINFITDTRFDGIKANLRAGVSEWGDDRTVDGSIAVGRSFMGGRLHLEGSYEYLNDPGIFSKLRRPWGRRVWGNTGAGTASNPYREINTARLSNTSFGGQFTSGALAGLNFYQNGVASPFMHGAATGTAGIEVGGDGGYYTTASLKSLLESRQAFGRADYDFAGTVHGYLQFSGVRLRNMNFHQNNEVRGAGNFGVLGLNNAFLRNIALPLGYANPYNAGCTANSSACTFNFGKIMLQAPTLNPETFTDEWMGLAGLDGNLGKYRWEFGYLHSDGTQHTRNNANLHSGRLLAAENAVFDPASGRIVCNAALVNVAYADCVPLNLFGPTSESQSAISYLLAVTDFWGNTVVDDYNAALSGAPFSSWAGPVSIALSAEYRQQQFSLRSNAQPGDHPDCLGIQFNCTANTALWISNVAANRSPVRYTVKEAAVEADVPLFTGNAAMRALNVNSAARYTHYNFSGTVYSWKLGLVARANDQLTVRATRSRDIRAPNLNELYAPVGFSPNGFVDRHTGFLQQQVPVYSQGNPNLVPEVADTMTAGFVWTPTPSFSIAVDGYRVKINNAIATVNGQNDNVQKLCEDSNGTSVYCLLYERPLPFSDRSAANFPTKVFQQGLNIARIETYGADVEVNWGTRIFGHRVKVRALAGYQPHIINDAGPAGITDNGGTAGNPYVKVSAYGSVEVTDKVHVQVQEQWRGTLKRSNQPTLVYADPDIASVSYTNVNVTYDRKDSVGTQWSFTIKNVFNQQPIPYSANNALAVPGLFGGFVQGDDNIGRYYTLGLRFRL